LEWKTKEEAYFELGKLKKTFGEDNSRFKKAKMEYEEQLCQWFDKYEDKNLSFEDLETKYNECRQVSAIVFLASKLKDKKERLFLHGEHDTLYVGAGYESFEEFTEKDVEIAVSHGVYISDDGEGGFQMSASM